ncbi:gluconokinase [Roseateles sp.]|uniref:gluconokinase n=1 Tax=Roseateles sp. TaxID=1971397 RepID=UPI002E010134|nr:gluconokinase [Roseateles sp.]
MSPLAPDSVVVMGVAGSGKSTLAAAVAADVARPWVDADDFHSESNRRKMAEGQPLDDLDRAAWLASLGTQLQLHPGGLVLACSALKRGYRDQLRRASPGLRFAFLDIGKAEAARRVATRGTHFFSASLVDSQFATLESPLGEPGVLRLDAQRPLHELRQQVSQWLRQPLGSVLG